MKLSIRNQLLGAFAINLVLMIILSTFALAQMGVMNERATLVENRTIPSLDVISKVDAVITTYRSLQLEYIINNSSADKNRLESEMLALESAMLGHFQRYDNLLEDHAEPQSFAQVQQAWEAFVEANHERFLPLARMNNTGTVQPIFNRLNPLYSALVDASEQLSAANQQQASEALGVVQSSYQTSRYVILSETGLTLVISALIGITLSTYIARRVHRLTRATKEVAAGDLEPQVEELGRDEIGVLAQNFNQMTLSLREQRATVEQRNAELQASLVRQRQLTEDLIRGKQAEEAATQAKAAAEAASQAKSMFLATMSHELRTPLTAILGYTQLMRINAKQRGHPDMLFDLERVHMAGKHLLTIISNILDFSKIEQGKMDLDLSTFQIANMVDEVVLLVRPLAAERENTLDLDIASHLGEMHADVGKLRQVLFNLLSNAAKFTENGSITLRVRTSYLTISSRQEFGEPAPTAQPVAIFTVEDTGIGIAPEHLRRLFQPFSQVDASATRRYGGTGLGLALSRELCQLMGGDISVVSQPNVGSTFTVILPLYVTDPDADEILAMAGSSQALF